MKFSLTTRLLGLAVILTLAAGCKKDNPTPAPSNTSLLTGPTWRTNDYRLVINGTEGTYTPAAANKEDFKFTADGKFTDTPASAPAYSGTWAFAANETQLQLTPNPQAPDPIQLFTLTAADLAYGFTYNQTQVQHALSNTNNSPTATDTNIRNLVLATIAFTFPNNTLPVSNYTQITSLSFKATYKPK